MMKQVLIIAVLAASASAFAPTSRPFGAKTSLSAEWEKDWKELDFEGDLAKIQKESEERLEEKVQELMSGIESTGSN